MLMAEVISGKSAECTGKYSPEMHKTIRMIHQEKNTSTHVLKKAEHFDS